jgi:hypothetical protein
MRSCAVTVALSIASGLIQNVDNGHFQFIHVMVPRMGIGLIAATNEVFGLKDVICRILTPAS